MVDAPTSRTIRRDVWYLLQDQDKYLYHYTSASTLTDRILPTGRFRLSRFQYVNDPREAKNWHFGFLNCGDIPPAQLDSLEIDLNNRLKHLWHVGCFTSDTAAATTLASINDSGLDALNALHERGHSRPRMWAQYASGYTGACLVFLKSRLDQAIRTAAPRGADVLAAPVRYQNLPVAASFRRPDPLLINIVEVAQSGVDNVSKSHVKHHANDLFFLKSRDWEAEHEFRWVVGPSGQDNIYVNIQDSLVGILLGDRFASWRRRKVGDYALRTGTEVAIMEWRNGIPQPTPTHARILATTPMTTRNWAYSTVAGIWLRLARLFHPATNCLSTYGRMPPFWK